eukprot:TRINITY_DN5850_c2_g1_i16.p6 TRINITY_DN5850_c2_g1~~TRINITY_DN5850_c2_g1_i16.p6  ORF type:complete len:111 (-),score=2.24 TRINITY_DN5850_c2_g1_i16:846-1178(-)
MCIFYISVLPIFKSLFELFLFVENFKLYKHGTKCEIENLQGSHQMQSIRSMKIQFQNFSWCDHFFSTKCEIGNLQIELNAINLIHKNLISKFLLVRSFFQYKMRDWKFTD